MHDILFYLLSMDPFATILGAWFTCIVIGGFFVYYQLRD